MTIDEGVTEVAESDEDPMTSSPLFVGADDAADKLPAMASGQPQELQDAIQNLHSTPQALGQDDAKSAPQDTLVLDVDRRGASADFDVSPIVQTDVKLEGAVAFQEEPAAPQTSHPDLAIHAPINSPRLAPRPIHRPVANSSMRPLPEQTQSCTVAQALDSNFAPKDACSKFAEDMINTCDSEAHDGRTHAGPSHVVRNGSSQFISEDIPRDASEFSDIIYPSENAVLRSQAMGASETTRTLVAATTNSLPSTTMDLTRSVLTPVGFKEGINGHSHPNLNEIGGQKSQINGVVCAPDIASQEPLAKAQDVSPFTPQIQTALEKPQVRILPLQKALQPSKASQGLFDTGHTVTESTCKRQSQTPMGVSSTSMLTNPTKSRQEITLSELKAQKASLLASLRSLPAIQVLTEGMASSDTGVDGGCDGPTEADIMNAANKIVKQHIKLLHEYNELKDVGQGLMGLIADQRGVRIVEVQEEFGVDAKD